MTHDVLRGRTQEEPTENHDSERQKASADTPTFDNYNSEFRNGLEHAINTHSMEAGSNTPDFVLAQYLADCLRAFDKATQHREAWHGRSFDNGDALRLPSNAQTLNAV